MAMERSTAEALPLPPRLSASPTSSPATVGALLTNAACASRIRRECRSPRSLLSRILGRGSGGFGCRMRIPRYCSSGAGAAAKEDAVEEEVAAAAPKVVMESKQETEARQSPRSSLQGMKVAPEVSAASLGLGAGLVLLLSRGAAELSRMAELRAQMERLVLDVRAEARGSTRSDLSGGGHADDGASVVKERIVFSDAGGGEDASLSRGSRDAASACGDAGVVNAAAAMDQMEAELEAELTRLQLDSDDDDEEECVRPRQGHQLESEAKSDISSESGSLACVHIDGVLGDAARDCKEHEDNEEEEKEEEEEGDTDEEDEESKPCHGGVPACVLERRLHELLQSRHEQRIAELETELQRAQKKLRDKEREVSRWRDTAKLVSRHKDESRLR